MNNHRPDELLALLREAFQELKLAELAAALDEAVATGGDDKVHDDKVHDDHDSRLRWLWRLVEPQIHARRERATERRLTAARFPAHKSLDNFDFKFQPTLDRERVLELATLDFVRRGQNLLVAGMSGTGKSHICMALGHLACAAGIRTRYTTSADMLSDLHTALATGVLTDVAKRYTRPQLLIIDEVGLDRPERDRGRDAQLFYKIVRPRHQEGKSTMITSNINWEDWGAYLGDDIATVAILDRLIEHGHLLTIEGPSWRSEQHRKLNAHTGGSVKTD